VFQARNVQKFDGLGMTLWLAVAGQLQGSYSSCGELFILLLSPAKTVADLCRMQM